MATKPKATPTKRPARKRNGDPKRPGRPHDLDRPVSFGGRTAPASEAIVAIMRSGEPLYLASRACGIHPDTAYNWRADGARISSQMIEDRLTAAQLTDYQRAALAFSEQVSRAEAEAEALMAARLGQVAAGGQVRRRTVTEYDGQGNTILTRVTEETTPPDGKAVAFWLERRSPERWGRAQRIEIAQGADGARVQVESPLEKITEALRGIERRKAAAPALAVVEIETTNHEERSA